METASRQVTTSPPKDNSSPSVTSDVLVSHDRWVVREMVFTADRIRWLWEEMSKYRSLFSDLTRGDVANFHALIAQTGSFWLEVCEEEKTVGIIYLTGMEQMIDADVHLLFFDQKPAEKAELCRKVAGWLFDHFHFHRLTATIPVIYYATVRLAQKIGFKEEGRKRESQLMGHKWVDEVILGLLYKEV